MDKLNAMRIFIRVTETGNFSKTADELNTTPSYVSKQISALEKSLGTRLLQRTTRVLTLTESGRSFLKHCRKIITQLSIAESEIAELRGTPSGLLRVSMPSVLGDHDSANLCAGFLKQYPEIELDISVEDRFVDMVEEGYDICVRASAEFPDSSLIYKRIGDLGIHLMASQEYLAEYGHPKTAAELTNHQFISHRNVRTSTFTFERQGKAEQVTFNRRVKVNSTAIVRHIVEHGTGMGFLPKSSQTGIPEKNRLVSLLPNYQEGKISISLVYPERTYTPLKVYKFIEFFEKWFKRYE